MLSLSHARFVRIFDSLISFGLGGWGSTAKAKRFAEEAKGRATEHLDMVRSGFTYILQGSVSVSVISHALINVWSKTLVPSRLLKRTGWTGARRSKLDME